MILLEGPNLELRARLRPLLLAGARQVYKELVDPYLVRMAPERVRLAISGAPGLGTTGAVTRLLNADHEFEVRDGLPLRFPPDHAVWHMAGSALAATGSLVLVCKHAEDDPVEHPNHPAVRALAPFLWRPEVWDGGDLNKLVSFAVNLWKRQLAQARLYEKYGGSGPLYDRRIMVVGERVNPFHPASSLPCPRAFTANQGCSLFLHAALAAAGGRYYLTNAVKERSAKLNRLYLAEEVHLVQPTRVIAMGSEAARALADLRTVSFTQTYHPQYWKRFKNKDFPELVELLRPITSPNQTNTKTHGTEV